MPISVSCPGCETAYRVPDSAAGKAVKCKKCGKSVPVAANKNGTRPAAAAKNDGAETKPKKGGVGKILAIIGGVLALGCLVCMGIGGVGSWWAYSRTRSAVVEFQRDLVIGKDAKDMNAAMENALKNAFKDMAKKK